MDRALNIAKNYIGEKVERERLSDLGKKDVNMLLAHHRQNKRDIVVEKSVTNGTFSFTSRDRVVLDVIDLGLKTLHEIIVCYKVLILKWVFIPKLLYEI